MGHYYRDVMKTAGKIVKGAVVIGVGGFMAGALTNETRHVIQDAERRKAEIRHKVDEFTDKF